LFDGLSRRFAVTQERRNQERQTLRLLRVRSGSTRPAVCVCHCGGSAKPAVLADQREGRAEARPSAATEEGYLSRMRAQLGTLSLSVRSVTQKRYTLFVFVPGACQASANT